MKRSRGESRLSSAFCSILFPTFIFCLTTGVAGSASASANERQQPPFRVEVTGHGQPMILIPGLSSSGEVWASTVSRYQSNYECHVLTLAGFAGQPPVKGPFLETVGRGIIQYIREKKLNRPVIVGHSLGGFLALWLASTEPDLVGPIVVVDSLPFLAAAQMPGATVESVRPRAEEMRKAMAAPQSPEQRRQAQASILQTMISDPAKIELATKWGLASDPETVAQAIYELFTTDLRADLARIKTPVLIVGTWIGLKQYASRDQIEKTFRQQYATLPDYKFVMSEKGKHFVMFDDPETLFREMDSFLAAHSQKSLK
jgi:N-formylmaleamate deformylase